MLRVIPYQVSSEIYQLDFISSEYQSNTIVVCPNPTVADDFRLKCIQSDAEVITISKFRDDLIKRELPDIKFTRKSELLLILAGIWKSKFSHLPKETFLQCFQYFTDLRSYTFNIELVDEVLGKLDENYRTIINLFWLIADDENLEIYDEHKAYHLLSDHFRNSESAGDKNIIFYGFTHLSGSQVDFLKALSIKNDIFIPLAKSVIETSKRSDWINWLEDQEYDKLLESSNNSIEKKQARTVFFQKNRLGEALKNYFISTDSLNNKKIDIFLCKKNPSFEEINEIPFEGVGFKTNTEILAPQLSFIQDALMELCENKATSIDEVEELFSKLLGDAVRKTNTMPDFKLIKVVHLYKNAIKDMLNLSNAFEDFDLFTLFILGEIVQLNLPRTYSFPISVEDFQFRAKGLEALEGFDSENETFLIAKSGYGKLKSTESVYHEDIMDVLSTIGPVRRTEFEFQILKHKLKEVLGSNKITLFLEGDILESDPHWSEVLENFQLDKMNLSDKKRGGIQKSPLENFKNIDPIEENNFSASRIQTFIDCKQKYYFTYVQNMDTSIRPKNKINPNDLGTLEHGIIEEYMTKYSDEDQTNVKELNNLAEQKLINHIEEHQLVLEELEYNQYKVELVNYSRTGIETLLKFKLFDPRCSYRFETRVRQPFKGSIDCMVETDGGVAILDFKRSSGSIPSYTSWLNFEKVQLWFYSMNSGVPQDEIIAVGYVNLSHGEDSFYHICKDELISDFKKLGLTKIKNKKDVVFENKMGDFKNYLSEVIEDINGESLYPARPLSKSVCTYCQVSNLCTRGGSDHV